jgi:MSHA pilin protein MshC
MKAQGFTLVELVTVIIILGVIATVLASRMIAGRDLDVYAARDQLLGHLRRVQLDALNNSASSGCQQMLLQAERYGPPDVTPCTGGAGFSANYFSTPLEPYRSATLAAGISLDVGGGLDVRFDRWGRPAGACSGGCDIQLTGAVTLSVRIESEGYIHAL